MDYKDYVYVRTDPDPIGRKIGNSQNSTRSDLAVTREHLKIARRNDLEVHRKRAVTERIGAAVAASGRPKLVKLLRRLKPGTGLVVCSIDGLGRDAADALKTIRHVEERGAQVFSLDVSYDDLLQRNDLLRALEAISVLNSKTIAEQTRAKTFGLGVAGRRLGRPPSLNDADHAEVYAALIAGRSIASLARHYNTSRQTILRIRAKLSEV
ncbi:MAG: recombinase family protein [Pseudomonadota bacterium]